MLASRDAGTQIEKFTARETGLISLDRSTIAIDAAVSGLGVILESELLAEQEPRDGRLVAPFDSRNFAVEAESHFVIRPPGFRNGTRVAKFETWLRKTLACDKPA